MNKCLIDGDANPQGLQGKLGAAGRQGPVGNSVTVFQIFAKYSKLFQCPTK